MNRSLSICLCLNNLTTLYMKESLEVRNFGPIPHINIEIKKLTILIGGQGTGKSTISKLLTIFRDVFWHWCVLTNQKQLRPFVSFKIDQYFKPDTFLCYRYNDIVITYQNGAFSYNEGNLSPEQICMRLQGVINNVSDAILPKLGYVKIEDMPEKDFELLLANFRTLLYIPAERIMASQLSTSLASIQLAGVPLGTPILEYMSLFEKAQKATPQYDVPFLGISFFNKDGKQYVGVKEDPQNKLIPLDACSSGIQSVLPLIMVMDYCCKEHYFDSFVVEEPEQNLFPVSQKELLRLIFRLWNAQTRDTSNMVITTHSPYTLTCVNVELLANIVGQHPEYSDVVAEIIPKEEWLNPDFISVYSLNQENTEYATNLINPKTHLIGANSIDTVSEIISSEYNKLYKLYLKQLKA